jgi:predicted amidohydrolase YtcJ
VPTAISTKKKSSNKMRVRYRNANLWVGDDSEPRLQSFDVVDGVLAPTDEVSAVDRTVDLVGAFVMPAFRDGHCHPLFAGREHVGPDVTNAGSVSEIQQILTDYASSHPEASWIDGAAYDRSITARFHRAELDDAISDLPVVLHGADHHTLWVNTRALELCGLLEAIPTVSVGSVDVDADGVPTGILREWEAMQLVLNQIPALTIDEELDCLDWAQSELLATGVVEVQDAWIDRGMTEIYLESARQDRLRVRTNLAFRADPATWEADFEYFAQMRDSITALNHPNLKCNAIKFFVDGVLGSSTASLLEPYVSGPNIHQHGEQVWPLAELLRAASRANELGYQLHLHAIGDAAVRTALDVIEDVKPSIQAVIAHTELVSDEDLSRFKTLDVTANFEPLWAREDGQLLSCVPQVGRSRIDKMYRMRDIADTGARVSFGSDWPVSSPNALHGLATAVTRSLPGQAGWGLNQALTTREALQAYTQGAAAQISNSKRDGLLREGEVAEFVVLSDNPLECSNEALHDLQVLAVNLPSEPLRQL